MTSPELYFVAEKWVNGSPYLEECDLCHDCKPLWSFDANADFILMFGSKFFCKKCLRTSPAEATVKT